MLSTTECKKKLNRNGLFYTDKEIETIKDALYKLAEIVHSNRNNN
jgi:hypothetical protein